MTMPDNAQRLRFNMDLAPCSIQEALTQLHDSPHWPKPTKVVGVVYTLKVSLVALLFATDLLQEYKMGVRVIPKYGPDEWSLVATIFIVKSRKGKINRLEIWSPGA